jgi:hypothetical protein
VTASDCAVSTLIRKFGFGLRRHAIGEAPAPAVSSPLFGAAVCQ